MYKCYSEEKLDAIAYICQRTMTRIIRHEGRDTQKTNLDKTACINLRIKKESAETRKLRRTDDISKCQLGVRRYTTDTLG